MQNEQRALTPQEQRLIDLKIQREELELEDLSMRVENEKARRASIARAHKTQMESLDDANRQIQAQQSLCKHRKGGKNLEGVLNGHDSNYSIWRHTYPWGDVVGICSRCGKEWCKPSAALKKEDLKLYKEKLKEYQEMLSWPTDNEPSGSQCFLIQHSSNLVEATR